MTDPVVTTMQDESDLLNFAFKQICDKQDWKNPIAAYVPWEQANVYMQAITFVTGTTCQCERVTSIPGKPTPPGGWALLRSIGYRAGPAGDH